MSVIQLSQSSLHFYHLEFILLYILRALVHCVALCSTGQHAEGGRDSIVGGHSGEKDVAPGAIGDICHFSYQYWPQTFPVFQFCYKYTKQGIERVSGGGRVFFQSRWAEQEQGANGDKGPFLITQLWEQIFSTQNFSLQFYYIKQHAPEKESLSWGSFKNS